MRALVNESSEINYEETGVTKFSWKINESTFSRKVKSIFIKDNKVSIDLIEYIKSFNVKFKIQHKINENGE